MGKKILVVDDMQSIRMLLFRILRDEGFELDEATNGQEAIEKCTSDHPPDIVLLDLLLPKMNGIACCERIKAINRNIVVIMVSTEHEEKNLKQAYAVGCDGYVPKPFSKAVLLEALRSPVSSR